MATIRTRIGRDGKTVSYQATVRVSGKETATQTFAKKEDAKQWAERMTVTARLAVHKLPEIKKYRRVLLREALEEFIKSEPEGSKDIYTARKVWKYCGTIALGYLTVEYTKTYIETLKTTNTQYGKPYSWSACVKHLDIIRRVIKIQSAQYNVAPPLETVSLAYAGEKEDNERERVLSEEEEARLIEGFAACRNEEHWKTILTIAIETGARESEIFLATRSEINPAFTVWTIPAEHTKAKKQREVPLSVACKEAFKRLIELFEARNLEPGRPRVDRLFYCFSSADSVSNSFARITRRVKLVDLHFHDLRHTAVTRMLLYKRKLSVYEIMRIVGHESMKMFNRYANVRGNDLVEKME